MRQAIDLTPGEVNELMVEELAKYEAALAGEIPAEDENR